MGIGMSDPIGAFIDHLRANGIGPADSSAINLTDKFKRYMIEGDRPKSTNGSYKLSVHPDGFAVGLGYSFKGGQSFPWHSKAARTATAEEKAEWKRKEKEAKAARARLDAEAAAKAAEKAKRLWKAASRTGTTPYLTKKGIGLHGARIDGEVLIVPMWSNGALVGLQRILPDGSKRFLTGTPKAGAWFGIKGDETLVICEGFATGAAIFEATGHTVVIAFDAGNLVPVAQAWRAKEPDRRIVFGADNDQWTTRLGSPWNPGIDYAQQAAVKIGGAVVIWPRIPEDDPDKRTDWHDVWATEGLEAVAEAFALATVERGPEPEPDDRWEREDAPPVVPEDPLSLIRPLGHNRGNYFFFPKQAGQIVSLSATAMARMQSLYMLAHRGFWEQHYSADGKANDSQICAHASAHLMAECHSIGIFQPENTRGVGAWIDGGKPVVNCGDVILGEGFRMHPAQFEGDAVYESGPRVIHLGAEPLSNKEASALRDICRRLVWKRRQFADLLAGWLVIAPIGSALKWRPHVWITGESGAGKSTVIEEIVKPVLGDIAIKRDGGTTEPGVRKALGASGRPYVLDEAESETPAQQQEMAKIIYLARRSSSGGVVENANATYQARSCFCFSAINPRVEQVADVGRITTLELQKDKSEGARERYDALISDIHATFTDDFSRRLFARTVANLPTLLHNIKVFSSIASELFGNRRQGDQLGPMLAGAFLLTSTREVEPAQARAWMQAQDWQWHTALDDGGDAGKLIAHIMTARVRYDAAGMSRESAIGDLVQLAADPQAPGHDGAVQGLKSYGIKVAVGRVLIANDAPNLRKLLIDTPYIPWARTLGDFPGANNFGNKPVYFMPGLAKKVTSIPLDAVLGDRTDPAPMPEDVEEPW